MVRRRPCGAPGPAVRRYRERMPVYSVRLGDGEREPMAIYALFVLNVGPGNLPGARPHELSGTIPAGRNRLSLHQRGSRG